MKHFLLYFFVIALTCLSLNSMSADVPTELKTLYKITDSSLSVELSEYKVFSETFKHSALDPSSILYEFLNFNEVQSVANAVYELEMALRQKVFSINEIKDSEKDFVLETLSNLYFLYTNIDISVNSDGKNDSSLMDISTRNFSQDGVKLEVLLSVKNELDAPVALDNGRDYFNYALKFVEFSQMLRYAVIPSEATSKGLIKTYQESLAQNLLGSSDSSAACKDLCVEGMCERKELKTREASASNRVVLTFKDSIELSKGIYCLEKDTDILSFGKFSMGPFSLIKAGIETFKVKEGDKKVERKRMTDLHLFVFSIGNLNIDLSVPFGETNKINGKKGADGRNRIIENYNCNCHEYCSKRIKFGFGSKCVDHDTRCNTCTRVLKDYSKGEKGSNGEPGIDGGDLKLSISHKLQSSGKILFMSVGGNGTAGFDGGKGKGGNPDGIVGSGGKGGDGGDVILPLYLLNDVMSFEEIITPLVPGGKAGEDGKKGTKSDRASSKDGMHGEFINF